MKAFQVFKRFWQLHTLIAKLREPEASTAFNPGWERTVRDLIAIGKPAVNFLIAELRGQNQNANWKAAIALGEIGDSRAIEPLKKVLNKDNSLQYQAVIALGKLNARSAANDLVGLCQDHINWRVRANAALALARIGDHRALELLPNNLDALIKHPSQDEFRSLKNFEGPISLLAKLKANSTTVDKKSRT